MPVPAFHLAVLAGLAQVAPSTPITVTAHPWAPFISPMGEPFRAHSSTDDTLADWFFQADRNRDNLLTAAEMAADADRFFTKLDTNGDGQIDPDELSQYEWEVAPEIQVMSRTRRSPGQAAPTRTQDDDYELRDRGRRREDAREVDSSLGMRGALQGAARYALLNIPEPVAAADADFNRAISRDEFRQAALTRFDMLDRAHEGRLTLAQLEALRPVAPLNGHRAKSNDNAADSRIGNSLPSGP
jgi:EF hand